MPGTLDLDFMRVKRKTRSHPTSPKGSPTRSGKTSPSSSTQPEKTIETRKSSFPNETGNEARKLRKRSDDGRYLFLAKSSTNSSNSAEKIDKKKFETHSTPNTPVCGSQTNLVESEPVRSKSVRTFVELLSSPATSDNRKLFESFISSSPKKSSPKKCEKDQKSDPNLSKRRVSRVCVILNDEELLIVSRFPFFRTLSCVETSVLRMRLLHAVAFSK